jgi:hypothetical protein
MRDALLRDFLERAIIAFELGLLSRLALPAEHGHVHVFRVNIEPVADALGLLGGNYR